MTLTVCIGMHFLATSTMTHEVYLKVISAYDLTYGLLIFSLVLAFLASQYFLETLNPGVNAVERIVTTLASWLDQRLLMSAATTTPLNDVSPNADPLEDADQTASYPSSDIKSAIFTESVSDLKNIHAAIEMYKPVNLTISENGQSMIIPHNRRSKRWQTAWTEGKSFTKCEFSWKWQLRHCSSEQSLQDMPTWRTLCTLMCSDVSGQKYSQYDHWSHLDALS
jgi:hypothetical protein